MEKANVIELSYQEATPNAMVALDDSPPPRRPKPSNTIAIPGDPLSLAWAAGFVDGEGCVHLARQKYPRRRNPYSYVPRLYVAQNEPRVLRQFREIFAKHKANTHENRRQRSHNRQMYTLTFSNKAAIEVLKELLPYLRRKKEEARMLIEAYEKAALGAHYGPRGAPPEIWRLREWYYRKLRRMK